MNVDRFRISQTRAARCTLRTRALPTRYHLPRSRGYTTPASRAILVPCPITSALSITDGSMFSSPRAACDSGRKSGLCCDQKPLAYTRTKTSTPPTSLSPSPTSSMQSTSIPYPEASNSVSKLSLKRKTSASAPPTRTHYRNGSAPSRACWSRERRQTSSARCRAQEARPRDRRRARNKPRRTVSKAAVPR